MEDVKNIFDHQKRKDMLREESQALDDLLKRHKNEESSGDSGKFSPCSAESPESPTDDDAYEPFEELSDMDIFTTDEEDNGNTIKESTQKSNSKQPGCEDILSDEEWL